MVGIVNVDYFRLVLKMDTVLTINAYTAPGLAVGVASGRLSFMFGLTGPAGSVDTACSSSLVALHMGLSTVERTESDDALSCGVNLALTPMCTMLFNQSGMMAQDGRCKTMDATADGYVRGEGVVVIHLRGQMNKKENNIVGAHLLSSVINQDGPSSSLTAPSGPSQIAALSTGTCIFTIHRDTRIHLPWKCA